MTDYRLNGLNAAVPELVAAYGRLHCWLRLFAQGLTMSCVPFDVENPGSVRHILYFPAFSAYSLPDLRSQTSFGVPVHGHKMTRLPLAPVPLALAHLEPWICSSSLRYVQPWPCAVG
jgi:hypothetical protein